MATKKQRELALYDIRKPQEPMIYAYNGVNINEFTKKEIIKILISEYIENRKWLDIFC